MKPLFRTKNKENDVNVREYKVGDQFYMGCDVMTIVHIDTIPPSATDWGRVTFWTKEIPLSPISFPGYEKIEKYVP